MAVRLRIDIMMNIENNATKEETVTVWTFVIGVLARGVLFYVAYSAAVSLQRRYNLQGTSLIVAFAGILALITAIDFAWSGFHVSMRSWTTLYLAALVITTGYRFYNDFSLNSISTGLVFLSILAVPVAVGAGIGCGATKIAKSFAKKWL